MNQRVLVVKGDGELERLERGCLENCNYELLAAGDAETALSILRRDRPDLVLLDLATLLGSGWDVTRVLCDVLDRAHRHTSEQMVIQVGELTLDLNGRRVEVDGHIVRLTPTEFALLRALAQDPGCALTRQELMHNGLGYNYEGLERTVDSHIKNFRQKLDRVARAVCLIETVFGVGYRLSLGDNASKAMTAAGSGRARQSAAVP
jgi:two-component system alkaline phosphatase synthesis response regulator PhoP